MKRDHMEDKEPKDQDPEPPLTGLAEVIARAQVIGPS